MNIDTLPDPIFRKSAPLLHLDRLASAQESTRREFAGRRIECPAFWGMRERQHLASGIPFLARRERPFTGAP